MYFTPLGSLSHALSFFVLQLSQPDDSNYILCKFLSTDRLIGWLSYGYLLAPAELLASEANMAALMAVLADGFVLPVYRTETLYIHAAFDQVLAALKDHKKTRIMVVDQLNKAITDGPRFHSDRRTYLRQALGPLLAIVSDKPGLLGPKVRHGAEEKRRKRRRPQMKTHHSLVICGHICNSR